MFHVNLQGCKLHPPDGRTGSCNGIFGASAEDPMALLEAACEIESNVEANHS